MGTGNTGLITIDPKTMWRTVLMTGVTGVVTLLGWLASLAWDQQVSHSKSIQELEKQIAIQGNQFEQLEKEHRKDLWDLRRRVQSLESSGTKASQFPPAGK